MRPGEAREGEDMYSSGAQPIGTKNNMLYSTIRGHDIFFSIHRKRSVTGIPEETHFSRTSPCRHGRARLLRPAAACQKPSSASVGVPAAGR